MYAPFRRGYWPTSRMATSTRTRVINSPYGLNTRSSHYMIGCDSFGDRNLFFVQNRFFLEFICDFDFLRYLCTRNGGLAQLARALAWHARGHRFDPDILHQSGCHFDDRFFFFSFCPCGDKYAHCSPVAALYGIPASSQLKLRPSTPMGVQETKWIWFASNPSLPFFCVPASQGCALALRIPRCSP